MAAGVTMERTSYLTAEEVQAAQKLHQRAPYALCNVSHGFFSLARLCGGLTFQGCTYVYMHGHDECIRDDVLAMVGKMRKAKRRAALDELAQLDQQLGLGLDLDLFAPPAKP